MLSKNLENSSSYDIFYKFWKKAQVYYTLTISRGGDGRPPASLDLSLAYSGGSNFYYPNFLGQLKKLEGKMWGMA